MKNMPTLQKMVSHWTDTHIRFDESTGEYVAFDEAALEHSRWATLNQARDALVVYAVVELGHSVNNYQIGEPQ